MHPAGKKLIIAEGEVPGFKVAAVPATRARAITTGSASCRPPARVMSGLPPADAAAKPTSLDDLDEGKFEETMHKSLDRDITTVTLASYDGRPCRSMSRRTWAPSWPGRRTPCRPRSSPRSRPS